MSQNKTKISLTSARISSATKAGLGLAMFGYLVIHPSLKWLSRSSVYSEQTITLLGLSLISVLVALLLFLVRKAENRPLSSIGLKLLTFKETLLAAGTGLVLSLSVLPLTLLVSKIIPSSSEGSISEVTTNASWWLLLIGYLVAAIVEETIYRGYLIERIHEITGKLWMAIGISVIAFVLIHLWDWNMTHILAVVVPLGFILSWIYIWKRNLLFNIIVHFFFNLPVVFFALS